MNSGRRRPMATAPGDGLPLSVVIFGASGDLTAHKLIPALYRLFIKGRLPEGAHIVGVSRSDLSDEQFRDRVAKPVERAAGSDWNADKWRDFAKRLFYVAADATKAELLAPLKAWLEKQEP